MSQNPSTPLVMPPRAGRALVMCVTLLSLAGCATVREPTLEARLGEMLNAPAGTAVQATEQEVRESGEHTLGGVSVASEAALAEPVLMRGTDRMLAQPKVRPGVSLSGEAVSLQFEQAPIADVIHAIYGDVLGLPYVITQSVTGTVTLRTARPLERKQVLPVMESLLAANGFAAVQDSAGVFHIGTAEAVRDVAPALSLPGADASGKRIMVVPLQFIGAAQMAEILEPVARPESIVRVDGFRNLLLLAGTTTQLEGWMEIVRLFDVNVLQGMSVGLFPLQHLSVQEVEAALRLVMSEEGGGAAAAAPARRAPSAQPSAAQGNAAAQGGGSALGAPVSLGGALEGVVRFIGIERMNALLVVSPRAHYLDEVRKWIERFDVRRDNLMEPRLFVYPVQNGTATHLASLLSAVFGGSGGGGASAVGSGVAPGLAQTSVGGSLSGAMSAPEATSSGVQTATVSGIELKPDVRIVADEHNNAILIHASAHEYHKIERALRDLDRAPTQVLIEASIIEVTLNDELKYGLQWFFHGGLGSTYSGQGGLNLRQTGEIAALQPGFSYSITRGAGDVRAVLNALADKSLLKVISSPSVLVLDNQTAKIHVGDQQPIRSSTSFSDNGNQITSSIEYKDTGVQLSVTPSVNAGGMVSMDVSQVVTDVGNVDTATDQRSFMQRYISSKIAARSGETVVLGGLIRDNDSDGRQGVPGLHEIPVFGNLFGATTRTRVRTELLVTLTPRVLESEADLRAIGDELRQKMRAVGNMISTLESRALDVD